jgi:16S rRNA (adenine1518-N6/adenine1519-N6)-dimethyltransferase
VSLEILKKYKIRAKKGLWQNFLQDDLVLNEIAESIEVDWKNIVEVGPGYWALTEKLLEQNPKNLDLVELDTDMIRILESRIENHDFDLENTNVKINHIDVLKYEPIFWEYDVIANIPYYITSPILRHFLYETENKPIHMVILMQEDVGNKILGKWKNKSSVLSLFIEKKCYVSEIIKVPKEAFVPAPKIESSVLLFESHNDHDHINDEDFLIIIKKWFAEPRKKLSNNLIKGGYSKEKITKLFEELGFWINTRGEDLDIDQWNAIVKALS